MDLDRDIVLVILFAYVLPFLMLVGWNVYECWNFIPAVIRRQDKRKAKGKSQ